MKKTVLALGLGLTLNTGLFAADDVIDQLNSQVVSVLVPFQNETTAAQLNFDSVETNTERAVKVALNGLFSKIGSQNKLEVKIDNLSYDYGDGKSPTTIIKGSLGVDITKILPQDQLNFIIPEAARMVEELAKEYSEEYGDAVSVKSIVTSTKKDSAGNYTSLTALISTKIDLSKLPEDMESEDVFATDAVFSISLDLKTGATIDAFVVSNPDYLGFKEGQEGLKETLDKLLAQDEETLDRIAAIARWLGETASAIVEMDNSLKIQVNKFLSIISK